MGSNQFITFDIPDVNKFIRQLDSIRDELDKEVKQSLEESAKEVAEEQKRILNTAEFNSSRLSSCIGIEDAMTKKGNRYYRVGYVGDVKEWLHGAVIEFGRPGKRGKGTIRQNRYGKQVTVVNGYIPEFSHIRRGFDNKQEQVTQNIKNAFNGVVDKMESGLNDGDT